MSGDWRRSSALGGDEISHFGEKRQSRCIAFRQRAQTCTKPDKVVVSGRRQTLTPAHEPFDAKERISDVELSAGALGVNDRCTAAAIKNARSRSPGCDNTSSRRSEARCAITRAEQRSWLSGPPCSGVGQFECCSAGLNSATATAQNVTGVEYFAQVGAGLGA